MFDVKMGSRATTTLMLVIGVITVLSGTLMAFMYQGSDPTIHPIGITLLIFGAWLFVFALRYRKDAIWNQEFGRWLSENKENLQLGPVPFRDSVIDLDTELFTYQTAISYLFLSTKVASRYFIKGKDDTKGLAVYFSMTAVILGWWGIPWGPIYTISALVQNGRGGEQYTVGELLMMES